MDPSPPPQKEPEKEAPPAPRPGGTLLRFKKLTNHLFGLDRKDESETGKDERSGRSD